MQRPNVIAEIGCNHMGDLELAHEMIEAAEMCGVGYVKFQKRFPMECLTKERYTAPYNSEHSFGATYGEHREALEFTIEQHADLKKHCDDLGLGYACSVWDITSAREIISLDPDYIKIPSAHNEDEKLIGFVMQNWKKPIHISNGMAPPQAEVAWVNLSIELGGGELVPYACTSKYPCEMSDVCLGDILRFRDDPCYSIIGFSGHHKGIALDVAAYTLGATYIERHFTLDRTLKGRDHAASLEPKGLETLVRDLSAVYSAGGIRNGVLDCELEEVMRKKVTKWQA